MVIWALAIAGGLVAVLSKDLLRAVIALALVDLAAAIIYFMLQAPDVAIVQTILYVGLSTAIFLAAISETKRMEE
jgi:uncharacterized MnhB-related membrane protein